MPRLKATAVVAALAAALCGVSAPAAAQSEATGRVILLVDALAPPPESLVQALRIQLSGMASLELAQAAAGAELAAEAERWAREPGVVAVLWQPADASTREEATALQALDHSAAGSPAGGNSELVRVPGGARPDVERSLALKVRELLHGWQKRRAERDAAQASRSEPPAAEPEPPAEDDLLGLALAAGAQTAPLSQRLQWGTVIAAGVVVYSDALRLVGGLQLAWSPELELSSGASHATLEELAPGMIARAELRQGDLWLGAHAGLSLSLLHATGSDGRERGEANEKLVSALVGLHAELEIAAGFGLYGGAGLQVRLHRERFTVGRVELIDVGRLRPIATLALAWTTN
jgi:hypothetical protein